MEAIARRAHGVFSNGMPFHATRGIEPLKVVHCHCEGGEYVNHHDSNGRLHTVLYYLNRVGGTWFPLDNPQYQQQHRHEINDLLEARQACIGRSSGENGPWSPTGRVRTATTTEKHHMQVRESLK